MAVVPEVTEAAAVAGEGRSGVEVDIVEHPLAGTVVVARREAAG